MSMVRGTKYDSHSEQQSKTGNVKVAAFRSLVIVFIALNCLISVRGRAQHESGGVQVEERTAFTQNAADHHISASSKIELQGQFARRQLLQLTVSNSSSESSTTDTRPLAVKRGRRDPFRSFHVYRGGYDVRSKHYWGSLAYTGIPGYGLAIAWLLAGLLLALLLCCVNCSCWYRKRMLKDPVQKSAYTGYLWFAALLVGILTITAIGSCAVVYVGTKNFTVEARKIDNALIDAGNNASDSIQIVTAAIANVELLLEPFGSSLGIDAESLNSTATSLNSASQEIQRVIHKNTRILDKIIKYLEIIIIACTSASLLLIFLGPVCLLLGWKRFFYFVVLVAWLLTALTGFLFGVNYALSNLVADTCDAISEYRIDPLNTTLNSLLPCEDLLSQNGALVDVATEIRTSFNEVNSTYDTIAKQLNQTFPPPCEPIGPPPSYDVTVCPNNTIPIDQLPQLVQPYSCSSNNTQTCRQQGKLLTDLQYKMLVAYAASVRTLLNVYPSIIGLQNCSVVANAFTVLLEKDCGPTKRASHLNWGASLALTTAMISLITSWLLLTYIISRRNRQRKAIFPVMPWSPIRSPDESPDGSPNGAKPVS